MKRSILSIIPFAGAAIVAATVFMYSCSQQELTVSDKTSSSNGAVAPDNNGGLYEKPLNRWIGAPIDGELGRKWIANYNRATGQTFSYTIPATEIQTLLDKGAIGISLHYAKDEKGQLHVLPMAVDSNSTIMNSENVITLNGRVDWATSQRWITNYAGEVHAHFFGANMYVQMLRQLKGKDIRLTTALNDENKPQLLMSDASLTTPIVYGDMSAMCPPMCPPVN